MLVQVDGWSGSGKSVLMYLLDGHPELYAHPFHDLLQFLFRKPITNEDWLRHKDIWELRKSMAQNTLYFRSENFIRQGKYIIEYKSGVQLDYALTNDFSTIDKRIIEDILSNDEWTPDSLLRAFYSSFQYNLIPSQEPIDKFAFMGGWRGKDNLTSFAKLYPNSKQIVVKRSIKDTIAIQTGRKPVEIDFRSKDYNNKSVTDLLKRGEVQAYQKYYSRLERMSKDDPERVLIIDFDQLIKNRTQVMEDVCQFLDISSQLNWSSSFLGQKIEYQGVDYSEAVFDSFEDLLTQGEIKMIEKELKMAERESKGSVFSGLNKTVKSVLKQNVRLSNKVIKKLGG